MDGGSHKAEPSGTDGSRRRRARSSCSSIETRGRDGSSDSLVTQLQRVLNDLQDLSTQDGGAIKNKVLSTIEESRKMLTRPLEAKGQELRRRFRETVTGDENTRVRDHILEKKREPRMTRLLDKMSFTTGVLTIVISEYVLLEKPGYFWVLFSIVQPTLLLTRYLYYRSKKWENFVLDFCYFEQILCGVLVFGMPTSCSLYKSVALFANGPLAWAILIWRNSLVFHDFEKMTSVFIHMFPGWLVLTMRWYPLYSQLSAEVCGAVGPKDIGLSVLLYLGWQLAYWIKTEVFDKERLDSDPEIQTSLRWMTSDRKSGMYRGTLTVCRRLGLLGSDEHMDHRQLKTQLIFMFSQFLYTLLTMLPASLLLLSFTANVLFIFFIFAIAVHNGGAYYIEVFSRRYMASVESQAVKPSSPSSPSSKTD